MKAFYQLHYLLLSNDKLKITYLETSDVLNEISFLFKFQCLGDPELIGKIIEQFDALTVYLNSIS